MFSSLYARNPVRTKLLVIICCTSKNIRLRVMAEFKSSKAGTILNLFSRTLNVIQFTNALFG